MIGDRLKTIRSFLNVDVGSVLGFSRQVVGLDIGSSAIKLVQIKETRQGGELQKVRQKPLKRGIMEAGVVNDAAALTNVLREVVREAGIPLSRVAISVAGSAVMIKPIQVPQMEMEELEEQLIWEAEQYIPYDLDEIYFDYEVLASHESTGGEAPQMTVLLIAARKDVIEERVAIVRQAGLNPCIVDVDSFALVNMYHFNYPRGERDEPEACAAIVNIGATLMNMNIMKGGRPVFTRDIPLGGDRYTEAIQRGLECSMEEAESIKRKGLDPDDVGEISEIHQEVAEEISRTLEYYQAGAPDSDVTSIHVCGVGGKTPGLIQAVSEQTGLRVLAANPVARMQTPDPLDGGESGADVAPFLGVAVGLALRKVGDR